MAPARLAIALCFCVGALGCARRPPPVEPALDCSSCEKVAPSSEPTAVDGARSKTLSFDSGIPGEGGGGSDRWSVQRIGGGGGHASNAARPRRVKRVDIDLVKAPFDEVARLLADTGHFNVVVEAPSAGAVTVKLRDVEPYDALVAIAEVKGFEVRYRAGIVIVGAPEKE